LIDQLDAKALDNETFMDAENIQNVALPESNTEVKL
jgi:hypothetical protein